MDQIKISDITLKQTGKDFSLSFREKIEITQIQKRGNCRSKVGTQRRNDKEDLW